MKAPRRGLLGNALLLGLLSLTSSSLGFLREILIVRRFGASPLTDAYIAAYSLPLMFFSLTIGSGLSLALVPRLSALNVAAPRNANRALAGFLSVALLPGILIPLLTMQFRGALIHFFTPGLRDPSAAETFLFSLSPVYYLMMVAVSFGAWQCARHATHLFGLIAVIQNAVIVAGIASLARLAGFESLIWFTLGAHACSFLFQLFMARRSGFHEPLTAPVRDSDGMRLFLALAPFALTLGIGGDSGTAQGEIVLVRYFGSLLEPGSITLLSLANKLAGMPSVLIGAALGTALLPSAARAAREGDSAALSAKLRLALTTAALLTTPLVVLYFDAPGLIASVVSTARSLRPAQGAELANILRSYAPAIAGWTYVFVLGSFLAAIGAARFLISAGVAAILAGAVLMKFLTAWYGAPGIALGVSCCSLLYVALMAGRLMKDRLGDGLLRPGLIILAGALGMHFILLATRGMLPQLATAAVVFALYLAWSLINRNHLHLKEAFTT